MNIDARLQLTMTQRLVMTPMLQQAIKLLQMSRIELVDLVNQELLENPVLDEIEASEEYNHQDRSPGDPLLTPSDDASRKEQSDSPFEVIGLEKREKTQETAVNWEDYFADNPTGLGYYGERDSRETTLSYEAVLSQPESLSEHLTWQLQMSDVSERMRRIGTFLIGQIDDDGYIRGDDSSRSSSDHSEIGLGPKELQAYRQHIVEVLCQKINAEFEREYLTTAIRSSDDRGILAMLLSQEYYDALFNQQYDILLEKLRYLTLEDLESIATFLAKISAADLARITDVPITEIESGLQQIYKTCRELRHLLEHHFAGFLKDKYEKKLERTRLTAEELYLAEYLLSHLSAEEIAYVASKERAAKAAKREKEVQAFLEKLRQSYAHVEQLQSHKYFLLQLYRIGVGILIENFKLSCPPRCHRLFIKLSEISPQAINDAAEYIATLRQKYYTQAIPVSRDEIEQTLQHIHTFAPPGIGARDLQECLSIQTGNLGIEDAGIEPIIENYLQELQQRQFRKIAEEMGILIEEVELVAKIISNMSPKPGSDFSSMRPEYIVPDIYVYKVDGEYEVVLNEDDLPYLRINPLYKKLIMENTREVSQDAKNYVDQKLRSAMWFIRSVEQRKRTIYKVGKSIVKFQQEFLEQGLSHLKPLVLRDVADDISMHESTVSRVTTNKYIHTPQGVFELKFFFHSGLESSSGDDVSSIAVKERIKQLITEEDQSRPLSDKAIEKILKKDGIAIARRTIAKYREELHIPSSLQRKCV